MLQVEGKYDQLTSCDGAWSLQHGDIFFLHETNSFFILFIFILQAADQGADRQQVCFFSEYLPFFQAATSNQRALTLAIRQYFFANASHVLIMFWHDFGRGRGGAMVAMFVRE